jgi:uncharacterized phage protein (TIGR01671 family)
MKKRELKFLVGGYNAPRLLEVKSLKFDTSVATVAITEDGEFRLSDEGVVLFQYTGMKDKNGVEIYEGYIVKLFIDGDPYLYEVIWEHERQRFGLVEADGTIEHESWAYTSDNDFEVIGNTYEHPQLFTGD